MARTSQDMDAVFPGGDVRPWWLLSWIVAPTECPRRSEQPWSPCESERSCTFSPRIASAPELATNIPTGHMRIPSTSPQPGAQPPHYRPPHYRAAPSERSSEKDHSGRHSMMRKQPVFRSKRDTCWTLFSGYQHQAKNGWRKWPTGNKQKIFVHTV